MNKGWDKILPDPAIWKECLRVLKPGGHMVAFGAPKLYHRLAVSIEDQGFEIRDSLMWVFGSGFPKSMDVSKAIDSKAKAVREVIGFDTTRVRPNRKYNAGAIGNVGGSKTVSDRSDNGATITAPSTDEAKQWEGWGTALKPAYEPIILARKPLEGTVASNVLKYGTGGLNIDECRIGESKETPASISKTLARNSMSGPMLGDSLENSGHNPNIGRFPANLILDEEAGKLLDEQAKDSSRFFYCAKTSKKEREAGLGSLTAKTVKDGRKAKADNPRLRGETERKNTHPTVKPISLMRWLVRLITPPGGTVLDPFTGSGSTGCAVVEEGFDFIGCELSEEYVTIANKRIEHSLGTQKS